MSTMSLLTFHTSKACYFTPDDLNGNHARHYIVWLCIDQLFTIQISFIDVCCPNAQK